jgi:hypothetical protein
MFQTLISTLQAMPTEAVWGIALLVAFASQVLMIRLFGVAGACVYCIIAIIAANIEVMKTVQFPLVDWTIPGGTLLFTSTYLATDIISEQYGKRASQLVVLSGLAGYVLFTLFMQLAIGYAPLAGEALARANADGLPNLHQQISDLFTPMPAFLFASMAAYLVSQMHDVWLFEKIKAKTGEKHLWLRNNGSTMVSCLIDNVVFSVLAWQVFQAMGKPLPMNELMTMIFATYVMRLGIALLDTPFMYLAKRVIRPGHLLEGRLPDAVAA